MPEPEERGRGERESAHVAGPTSALAHAAGTHAVVVVPQPAPPELLPRISRRGLLLAAFWAGIGALGAAAAAAVVNLLWPRRAQKIGGTFALDLKAADIAPGEKRDALVLIPNASDPVRSEDVKLYVLRFDAEQAAHNPGAAEGAYLALWRKCPHLGCTIPWVPNFTFTDPLDGQNVTGWFRCPCHGSTYTDAGRRVFGPAPRSMDAFALQIAADGTMTVDLGMLFKSVTGNAEQAQVQPG